MFRYGELLKMCRISAGLSQADLAIRSGTSQGYLSAVERGKYVPKIDWMDRALNVCGYEIGIRQKL